MLILRDLCTPYMMCSCPYSCLSPSVTLTCWEGECRGDTTCKSDDDIIVAKKPTDGCKQFVRFYCSRPFYVETWKGESTVSPPQSAPQIKNRYFAKRTMHRIEHRERTGLPWSYYKLVTLIIADN